METATCEKQVAKKEKVNQIKTQLRDAVDPLTVSAASVLGCPAIRLNLRRFNETL